MFAPSIRPWFVALLSLLGTHAADAREWTDSTGKNKTEAEFVEVVDDQVRLQKPDGTVITVPFARISRTDQRYVINQFKQRSTKVPQLGQAGTQATAKLLQSLRLAAAEFGEINADNYREWEQASSRICSLAKSGLQKIASSEKSRFAATPAIVSMLEDKSPLVALAGIRSVQEMGPSAVAAGPALAKLIAHPSQRVNRHAYEALSSLVRYSDSPVEQLITFLEQPDDETADGAMHALAGVAAHGPQTVAGLSRLITMTLDKKRSNKVRTRAVLTLHYMLRQYQQPRGDETTYRLAQLAPDLFDELEQRLQLLRRKRKKNCQELAESLMPLLATPADPKLLEAAATVVATYNPEQFKNVSPESLFRILNAPPTYELEQHLEGSLKYKLSELMQQGQLEIQFKPDQLLALLKRSDRELHYLVEHFISKMGSERNKLLPNLAALASTGETEQRLMVIQVLRSGIFTQADDLSQSPALPVIVKSRPDGKVDALTALGQSVTDLRSLSQKVSQYQPPNPAKPLLSVEQILAKLVQGEKG